MFNLYLISAGILMGGLLTASVTLTNANEADPGPAVNKQNVTLQFQQAGEQIEDAEIKAYYEALMGTVSPHLSNPDETGANDYLPDIKAITQESLTTPFQQAGLQIEDPQLKAVYDRLVGKIGLDQ